MSKIEKIRPVLLSAPYAKRGENLEVDIHLRSGYRTTGMVEITLEDGTVGLGEGYLAVFAPKVFVSIVELISPHIIGRDVNDITNITRDLSSIINYWSLQGAARHVYSAYEIALHDCKAQLLGIPVYKMLGGENRPMKLYGSGGDSPTPEFMTREFELLESLGIDIFKIRARNDQINKTIWCMEEGKPRGIQISVDMCQNLANPGQTQQDILTYYESVTNLSDGSLFFFEEILGVMDGEQYPELRKSLPVKRAGGEIVTTPEELAYRIKQGWYDIAQPDATVIGGINAVLNTFEVGSKHGTDVVVHSWGGPVGMMANYHAALAGKGTLAEWPMPNYPLRNSLVEEEWQVSDGYLFLSDSPGLGLKLTPEIEKEYAFREDAVYSCLGTPDVIPPDEVWN